MTSRKVKIKTGKAVELERYRLLVDSVQDYAIFLLEPDGTVASWNPGAKRFKGYEAEEIIGQHFSKFYSEADIKAKKPEKELEMAIRVGRLEDEGWRLRKDGSAFWANVVITALFNTKGDLQGFAKVTRDLTERKAMEDSLVEANKKLRLQQQELKSLNEVKDEFISLASHQLRTPATAVKLYLGMILEGFAGDLNQQRLLLEKAHESNERQIALINDLLRVAQIDAGKIQLEKEEVNINKLVIDTAEDQQDNFKKRNQKLILNLNDKVSAEIDSKRFRMALDNLIDNASKYTQSGGKITISLIKNPSDFQLSIMDTGVGIGNEDIQKLFTKFTRFQNELSDNVGGSGLGLYWAFKILEMHGGKINVQSQVGKGSTFTLCAPLSASV